jgi:hypothetical protein
MLIGTVSLVYDWAAAPLTLMKDDRTRLANKTQARGVLIVVRRPCVGLVPLFAQHVDDGSELERT